jgi:hypothetical protein
LEVLVRKNDFIKLLYNLEFRTSSEREIYLEAADVSAAICSNYSLIIDEEKLKKMLKFAVCYAPGIKDQEFPNDRGK